MAVYLAVIRSPLPGADKQVERALECMDFMRYEEAISLFNEVLNKNPEKKGLRVKQAFAYFRLNRPERAVMVLHKELELFPEDPGTLVLLSFIAYKQKNYDEAQGSARVFLNYIDKLKKKRKIDKVNDIYRELFPNGGIPSYILGLLEKRRGNNQAAAEYFGQAGQLGYNALDCRLQMIDMELERRNWRQALAVCLEFDMMPPEVYLLRAFAYSRIGDANQVLESLKRAHGLMLFPNPEAAIPYVLEAYAYYQTGDVNQALEFLIKAFALKPFESFVVKNLAILRLLREDFEEAAKLYRRLVLLNPQDFEARLLLEQAEKRRRQPEDLQKEAISKEFMNEKDVKYRYIFEGRAEDIGLKANVNALSLVREGLLIDAARWLRRFIEIYDSSPTLYYNLAQIYNALDIRGDALRFASRAIELKKDYRDAYDLSGNLSLKVQDLERSVWYYKEAVRIEPDSMGYYNLGCAYYEMSDLDKAEESWLAAIKNETAAPEEAEKIAKDDVLKIDVRVKADTIIFESYQALGRLYEKQGKLDAAGAAFERAIKLLPKMPAPYFELGKICLDRKEKEKADEFFKKYISLGGDEAKVKAVLSRK